MYVLRLKWFILLAFFLSILFFALISCDQNGQVKLHETTGTEKLPLMLIRVLFDDQVPSKLDENQVPSGASFISSTLSVIKIDFNYKIDSSTFTNESITFRNEELNTNIDFRFTFENDSTTIVLTRTSTSQLVPGTAFTLFVSKSLTSTDGRSMTSDFKKTYTTHLLKDVSLFVYYANEPNPMSINIKGNLEHQVPNATNMQQIPLRFTIGDKAKLLFNETVLYTNNLTDYRGQFDFSTETRLRFTVEAQAGNTQDYYIQIIQEPPFQIIADFQQGDVLPSKYSARFRLSDPEAVSPRLFWTNVPPNTGSYLILGWNENLPNSNRLDWFLANVPNSVGAIFEGSFILGSSVLKAYEGFAIPPENTTYTIHYSVFAIAERSLNFGAGGLDINQTADKLIDYVKQELAGHSPVAVTGITINAVADVSGIYESP